MIVMQDWLMRQITMMAEGIARLMLGKGAVKYEIEDETSLSHTDLLYKNIMDLVKEGKLCQAEDELYDVLEPGNGAALLLALDFYETLNRMSDRELELADFSREEVESGLQDVLRRYGLSVLLWPSQSSTV